MIKIVTTLLLISSSLIATAQNQKNMKTTEKFNTEYYKKKVFELTGKNQFIAGEYYIEADGTSVSVFWDELDTPYSYFLGKIIPLSFRVDCKTYHPNKILKNEWHELFMSLPVVLIGIEREYDSLGNLTKEINHDRQFDSVKMKPQDLLQWMHNFGFIDLNTGRGQEEFGVLKRFRIFFVPAHKDSIFKRREPAQWKVIETRDHPAYDCCWKIETTYTLNAETGKGESVHNKEIPPLAR